MAIYMLYMAMPVIVWIVTAPVAKESLYESQKYKRNYMIICGVLIFLMLACRHYSVGSGDGEWYFSNWEKMSTVSFENLFNTLNSYNMESGYLVTVWILSHIFKDPQFLFMFYGLLVSVSICRFIYKNCDDVVVALVMFNCLGLWGFMVQGIRQGIAMSICLFAIEYAKRRKFFPFLLVVLIAMLFHASAVVFLLVYAFGWLRMKVGSYFLSIMAIFTLLLFSNVFFDIINQIINDSYLIGSIEDTSGGYISTAIYVIIIFLAVVFCNENKQDASPHFAFFFYLTLCGFITFIMRYNLNSIAQRISYYFMFGQMITLPAVAKRLFVPKQRALVSLLVIMLCLGIALYKATYSVLVPYTLFWQA